MNFKKWLIEENYSQNINPGYFSNTNVDDIIDIQMGRVGSLVNVASDTLHLPTRKIDSKINKIYFTKNPITITLENGTTWRLNKQQWDYLKQIGKEPMENKNVTIISNLDGSIVDIQLQ